MAFQNGRGVLEGVLIWDNGRFNQLLLKKFLDSSNSCMIDIDHGEKENKKIMTTTLLPLDYLNGTDFNADPSCHYITIDR